MARNCGRTEEPSQAAWTAGDTPEQDTSKIVIGTRLRQIDLTARYCATLASNSLGALVQQTG